MTGKIAFVTGGTRGIGAAAAEMLAAHGFHLAINGRSNPDMLQASAEALSARHGIETLALAGDVSSADQVQGFYRAIHRRWKRLDVLVNNAGILEAALIGMASTAMIDRVLDVNTKGAIYNLQAAARLMGRAGSGSIINVASMIGLEGREGQIVYSASKAALVGLTYSAAKELAPRGIRVNAVAPGLIETELLAPLAADKLAEQRAQIGMGRAGTPLDVARAILFFALDQSSYVTGQVLGVDGGMRW